MVNESIEHITKNNISTALNKLLMAGIGTGLLFGVGATSINLYEKVKNYHSDAPPNPLVQIDETEANIPASIEEKIYENAERTKKYLDSNPACETFDEESPLQIFVKSLPDGLGGQVSGDSIEITGSKSIIEEKVPVVDSLLPHEAIHLYCQGEANPTPVDIDLYEGDVQIQVSDGFNFGFRVRNSIILDGGFELEPGYYSSLSLTELITHYINAKVNNIDDKVTQPAEALVEAAKIIDMESEEFIRFLETNQNDSVAIKVLYDEIGEDKMSNLVSFLIPNSLQGPTYQLVEYEEDGTPTWVKLNFVDSED